RLRVIPYSSCRARMPAQSVNPTSHQCPSQTMPSTIGSRAALTTSRDQKALMRLPAAEAPLAASELVECLAQVCLAEVRPERLGEDELRIRALPEQEVRESLLARGPDQQIRVG